MRCSLAFLLWLPYIFTVASNAAVTSDSLKTRVTWMSKQLVLKINSSFRIPPLLTTTPPSREHYGAASVVLILKGYHSLILDSFNGALEVKAEMESLYRTVDVWKQRNCSDTPRPQAPRALEELRDRRRYAISVTYAALYRTKEYLKNLLQNMDQLETCL